MGSDEFVAEKAIEREQGGNAGCGNADIDFDAVGCQNLEGTWKT